MEPQISIGVPVYNGSPSIYDALKGIQRQTFKSFEVLISDNCSEDNTAELCKKFCEADGRFQYVRQSTNIGLLPNFEYLLKNSKAPLFCWFAYDDYTDDNYLEVLEEALTANPRAILAVGHTHWRDFPANYEKWFKVSDTSGYDIPKALSIQFRECCAGWFYGLYRREPLIPHWDYCRDNIGFDSYNGDIITMAKLVAEGHVVSSSGTVLHLQRLTLKQSPLHNFDLKARTAAFKLAWRTGSDGIAKLPINPIQKALLRPLLLYFINRRIIKVKPLLKANIRRSLGLSYALR